MGVFGFIESFPNGDIGIITQTATNEVIIKLNGSDFQNYLSELVDKAKKMGVYQCKCEKKTPEATSCPVKKPNAKPIELPNPKTHGNISEDTDCKS